MLSRRRPGEELSTAALDLTAAMREDAQAVQGKLQLQRTQSKELYAAQIRQKKEKRDKSLGEFARHDGVHVDPLLDVLAVSRFLQKRKPPPAQPQVVQEASEEEEELRGASTANLLAALHSGDTSVFSHTRASSSSDEEGPP